MRFNKGISAMKGAAAAPIPEESRIIHDSITVLSASQDDKQLPTPPATEHQDSESESESESSISSEENKEPTLVNSSLLLQGTEPA